jgi:hypothetical protein
MRGMVGDTRRLHTACMHATHIAHCSVAGMPALPTGVRIAEAVCALLRHLASYRCTTQICSPYSASLV